MMVLAFPNYELWYLAWIAFAPLILAAMRSHPLQAFLIGLIFGTTFFYGSSYWITNSMIAHGKITPAVAYLLAIIPAVALGAFSGIFCFLLSLTTLRLGAYAAFATPLLWTTTEYLRHQITDMGWNMVGYSQSFVPELIWPASYGGVYLVGALTTIPALGTALAIVTKDKRLLCFLLLPVAVYLSAKLMTKPKQQSDIEINVVVVQANAPVGDVPATALDEALQRQIDMTDACLKSLGNKRPVLVIWPEAPFNFAIDTDPQVKSAFEHYVRSRDVYLIFNANTQRAEKTYNSVLLMSPSGKRLAVYDKIHLLPFGEYVPFRNLPLFAEIAAIAGEYEAGKSANLLEFEGYKLGPSICFEAVFPELHVEFARRGAQALVNVADDAWFGNSPEMRQHLAHAVMRSVETGLRQFRVTNTGITALITPDGKVEDETKPLENASRLWKLQSLNPTPTTYVKYGDTYAISACILTVCLVCVSLLRRDSTQSKKG
ncbi:MAG: apolipoprotein N-acyltransferase [Blastocatellia bacterium]|nr:apolipoprotein N-acyltransferase [Blastocatellia bacterium]